MLVLTSPAARTTARRPTRRRPRVPPPRCGSTSCTTARGSSSAAPPVLDQPEAALQALAQRRRGRGAQVDEWHRPRRAAAAQRWPLAVKTLEGCEQRSRRPTRSTTRWRRARARERAQALELLRRLRDDHDLAAESRHYEAAVRVPPAARWRGSRCRRGARGGRAPRQVCVRAGDRREEAGDADGSARLYASGTRWRVLAPARRRAVRARPARSARGGVRGAPRAHEVGNSARPQDHHRKREELARRDAAALPRVETLLAAGIAVRLRVRAGDEERDCSVRVNKGCLVVLPTSSRLMEHKPYEQYDPPPNGQAIEPEEVRRRREEDFC